MAVPAVEPTAPGRPAARQITANGIWLLLAYVGPRLGQWVAVLVAARVLGADRFGWYGTAASLAVIASVATTLGIMPLLIRDLAREPSLAPALLSASHRLKTWTNLGMFVMLAAAVWLLDYPGPVAQAALMLGVAYAIGSYAENFGAYFQAIERMRVWMQANALLGSVAGVVGVTLVVTTGSIVAFCAAMVVGQAAALWWLTRQARLPGGHRLRVPAPSLIRGAAPFALAFVTLTVFYKVDVLIVDALRGPRAVGIYTAAYKFIDVTHALALVGIGALYPRLSRLLHGNVPRGARSAARALELITLPAVMATGLLAIGGPRIVTLAFGGEYAAAGGVLTVLALAIPFLATNLLMGYVLGARNRMQWVAAAYGVGLLAKVLGDLVLIRTWGEIGAAAGMLGAEVVTASLLLGVLVTREGIRPRLRAVLVPGAAWVGAGGLVAATGGHGLGFGLLYVLGVCLAYRFFGVLTSAEWSTLAHVVESGAGTAGGVTPEPTR